nr:universal stress protein [Acanthopleuribacter pedis]
MPLTQTLRIAVGIDFSEASLTALVFAKGLAKKMDMGLDLVHVCDPSTFRPSFPYKDLPRLEDWLHQNFSEIRHQSCRRLVHLADGSGAVAEEPQSDPAFELSADGHIVFETDRVHHENRDRSHFLEGNPARRLLAFCEDNACHMLVIGAHGHQKHGGIGQVARALIRDGRLPVVIAREPVPS